MKLDLERRRANLPRPNYPEELPVVARREEIARAVAEHQVVIVCGETGSGKTTQLPKICLELGRGVAGMIGHTQPRRIAARTVAARIASELASPLGHAVGYKVRFSDRVSPDTYIKVMTDGILLAETQGDRMLRAYDTLIIDEAHERSLNIDFLLGYVKELLRAAPRPQAHRHLRDDRCRALLAALRRRAGDRGVGTALPGRDALPPACRARRRATMSRTWSTACSTAVDELAREPGGGDVLVFLPGEREIRETADALRGHHPEGAEILPLYARLSLRGAAARVPSRAARAASCSPPTSPRPRSPCRASVTSSTPGSRESTATATATRSSSCRSSRSRRPPPNQRAGRCGRVAAGVCVRLYCGGGLPRAARNTPTRRSCAPRSRR